MVKQGDNPGSILMKRIIRWAVAACLAAVAASACGSRQKEAELSASLGPSAEEMAKLEKAFKDMTREKETADSLAEVQRKLGVEPVFIITTNYGNIKVKLYNDTPLHRDNFTKLANSGFYNGTLFHRVVEGFVIQGGDPYTKDTSMVAKWGEGGPGYTVPAEFVADHVHKKGALAAARRGDIANPMKESSGSQFYIVADGDACFHLNGDYTVFGETIDGIKTVELISSVKTDRYDRPVQDVKIISIRLEGAPEIKERGEGGQEGEKTGETENDDGQKKLEELKNKFGKLKDIEEVRRERAEAEAQKKESISTETSESETESTSETEAYESETVENENSEVEITENGNSERKESE